MKKTIKIFCFTLITLLSISTPILAIEGSVTFTGEADYADTLCQHAFMRFTITAYYSQEDEYYIFPKENENDPELRQSVDFAAVVFKDGAGNYLEVWPIGVSQVRPVHPGFPDDFYTVTSHVWLDQYERSPVIAEMYDVDKTLQAGASEQDFLNYVLATGKLIYRSEIDPAQGIPVNATGTPILGGSGTVPSIQLTPTIVADCVRFRSRGADAQICNVFTEAEGAVKIRVGPGTNRTAVVNLPVDTAFTVLGYALARDESRWLRLVKEEVAPRSRAAELWVAEDDIILVGDCSHLEELSAPPIIPIIRTPTPAPASEGATTGVSTGDETAGGSQGNVISGDIASGSWLITLTYGPTEGPCHHSGNPSDYYYYTLTPSPDGSTIAVSIASGGSSYPLTMTRTSGTSYIGTQVFPELNNQTHVYTWTFTSPTTFEGKVDTTFARGGCVIHNFLSGQAN
ncbi:MAG: hypothetical protein R3E39_20190 [Anaerolineae bacterium]